jgi:hypothetical protein
MNFGRKEISEKGLRFLLLKLSGSNLYGYQMSQERSFQVKEFRKLIRYSYFTDIHTFAGVASLIPRNQYFSKEMNKNFYILTKNKFQESHVCESLNNKWPSHIKN